MERFQRAEPLPAAMQGRWVEMDEPASELVVTDGEIVCFGAVVEYDYKDIGEVECALTVQLGINADDDASQDTFHRANITGLVISPEGEFLVYNVKFGAQFVRP